MKRKRCSETLTNTYKRSKNKENYNNKDVMSPEKSLKKTFKNIVSHTKKRIKNIKPTCKKVLMKLAHATAQELASDSPINIPRINYPYLKLVDFFP